MRIPCIQCKGDDPEKFCGRKVCPIHLKSQARFKVERMADSKDFSGSAPTPFVGRYGYPSINVGILSLPEKKEDAWKYDAPNHWSDKSYEIPSLVEMRSSLINSRFKSNVHEARSAGRMLGLSQEVGMASKPVDIEISLEAKPKFQFKVDPYVAPMGPNAKIETFDITSNPKVPRHIDKVVYDTDLRAGKALVYLHDKGFDENYMTRIFSVGNLGLKKNRKLVPTRWSITAVDDTLAKDLHKKILSYPDTDYQAFFGGYLGNYFLVLFFPDVWSYELFETYMPKASWNISSEIQYSTDFEPFSGRKTYAENCGGGYYAARLPVLETLDKMHRQASVLVFRFITGEYSVPLGVWVVREAIRKSLSSKPIMFSDKELMMIYAKNLVKKKFGYELQNLIDASLLLKNMKTQTKLKSFF